MPQEAKVAALEHLVVALLSEIQRLGGSRIENIYDAARASILEGNYPSDDDSRYAAKGALEDMATLIPVR
ncbi:hypothetical protein HRH33_12875 [Pseudomonas rhodesiae]|uniref:hypothetical protein n=1 Tax=Pseudomonas rhodesiae TaxID=76760 RepID=UPI00156A80C9|nr:hypothetical protein [Pseudomonas rhodesiae]QKJ73434.1 hypothetical protein HRH33_12875 [Pseudomonas rhodesiae]